jgi:hypothetical protein
MSRHDEDILAARNRKLTEEKQAMIDKAVKDHELIMAIVDVLDAKEWNSSTLDEIADLLQHYGYKIRDLDTGESAL